MNAPKVKSRLVTFLKILLVVTLLTYLLSSGKLDFAKLRVPLERFHLMFIGAAVIIASHLTAYFRFHVLLSRKGIPQHVKDTFRICLIGQFFNTCMPGAVGGDVVKLGYIIKETGKTSEAVACAVADRIIGMLGLLTIGAFALIWSWHEVLETPSLHNLTLVVFGLIGSSAICSFLGFIALAKGRRAGLIVWGLALLASSLFCLYALSGDELALTGKASREALLRGRALVAIGLAFLAGLIVALVAPSCQPGRTLESFIRTRLPMGERIMQLIQCILAFREQTGTLIFVYLISIVLQTGTLAAMYFFSQALELPNPPTVSHILFAGPPAIVINALPISFGGLAVGETALQELLSLCRNSSGEAITGGAEIFLLLRCWMLLVGLFGLPFYLLGKKDIQDARRAYQTSPPDKKEVSNLS